MSGVAFGKATLPKAPCLEGVGDVTIAGLLREQNGTTSVKDFKPQLVLCDLKVLLSYRP